MPDSMLHMQVQSNYSYQELEGKVLFFRMNFIDSKPLVEELENAAQKMESVAKGIVSGFSRTGNLHDNIHARVVGDGRTGRSIVLESLARANQNTVGKGGIRENYNAYYGGHVEYGHHTRNGGFVMAKPYMRPAMEMVSQSVNLADAMAVAFNGMMTDSLMMGNVLSFTRAGMYGMFSPMNKTYASQIGRLGKQTTGSWSKRGQSSVLSKGYERMRYNYTISKGGNSYKGINSWFNNRGTAANKVTNRKR